MPSPAPQTFLLPEIAHSVREVEPATEGWDGESILKTGCQMASSQENSEKRPQNIKPQEARLGLEATDTRILKLKG